MVTAVIRAEPVVSAVEKLVRPSWIVISIDSIGGIKILLVRLHLLIGLPLLLL